MKLSRRLGTRQIVRSAMYRVRVGFEAVLAIRFQEVFGGRKITDAG
jgi:hypothetical protein